MNTHKQDAAALKRCTWCNQSKLYQDYHDHEWGRPVTSSAGLFERLSLESMQSGLSWITVLKKRDAFRRHFADFDFHLVQGFDSARVEELATNPELIRHKAKIQSVVHNAQLICAYEQTGLSFAKLLWSYAPPLSSTPSTKSSSEASMRMSKELKRMGFKWVGATTCYSLMQAVGMVNDHAADCFVRGEVQTLCRSVHLRTPKN